MNNLFSYHHDIKMNVMKVIALPIIGIICLCLHFSGFDEQPFITIAIVCFVLALVFGIYGLRWKKAGPKLSGDENSVRIRLSPFQETKVIPWKSVKRIEYELTKASPTIRTLIFYLEDGEEIEVSLNSLVEIDINDFQALVTAIAPHVEWIWPTDVKGILDIL